MKEPLVFNEGAPFSDTIVSSPLELHHPVSFAHFLSDVSPDLAVLLCCRARSSIKQLNKMKHDLEGQSFDSDDEAQVGNVYGCRPSSSLLPSE